MKRSKKAQLKLSFGMIFSIILIIFFIAFAFFGIKKFLGIQEIAQIELFKSDLQEDIDRIWTSNSGSQDEFEYNLPKKVEKVCFVNDEYENLFFVPNNFKGGKIKHLNLVKIVENSNQNPKQFCISTSDRKITMTLKKSSGESSVIITK